MAEEDLKGLSPAERIKRLRELEKKKKQEIAEAQKMLKESEKELTDREEWERKVPIPQVAAEQAEGLSEAEKEILKTHKGLREVTAEPEEEEPAEEKELVGERPPESLERAVAEERPGLPRELMESDYADRLSQEPIGSLYQEIKDIKQTSEESGYVSPEAARRIEYRIAGLGKKLEDIETGRYSLTEEIAEESLLSRSIAMGASILGEYKRKKQGDEQRNTYQR